jgi:hypothetical protein
MASTTARALAQAYNLRYPVCIRLAGNDGDWIDCRYTSIEHCRLAASGRAGQCMNNPFYVPREQPPQH